MAGRRLSRLFQRRFRVPGGVAGESGRPAALARPAHSADASGPGARCDDPSAQPPRRNDVAIHFERRRLSLQAAAAGLLSAFAPLELLAVTNPESIRSVRLWPAPDYTRITIETAQPLRHQLLTLSNPDRIVVDIEGADFASLQ